MQDSLFLLGILLALLVGLAAGKAWERYKLVEGRWVDRRRSRQLPHFILGLNYLVAGQVDLSIAELEKAASVDPGALGAHTSTSGHGVVALTACGREHGHPAGALPA